MDIDAICKTMGFAEGKSKEATLDFVDLIAAREDVVSQLSEAVREGRTDAELVQVMRRPFLDFNNKLRKKLPRAKSQAEWRGMFFGVLSIVDWDLLAVVFRIALQPRDDS